MKWRGISETDSEQSASTLREELAERKRLMELYVPADTRAVNEHATEALRNSGITVRALKVGAQAPAFALLDHNGNPVSSGALLAKGPLGDRLHAWALVPILLRRGRGSESDAS